MRESDVVGLDDLVVPNAYALLVVPAAGTAMAAAAIPLIRALRFISCVISCLLRVAQQFPNRRRRGYTRNWSQRASVPADRPGAWWIKGMPR